MKFKGAVKEGKFRPDSPADYAVYLAKNEGKRINAEYKQARKNRSQNQNRYYWDVVLRLISDHTGYSQDEVHDILKQEFLGKTKQLGGKAYRVATTTKQSTTEFEQYLSKIRTWASMELQVYIPMPNEY